MAKVSAMTETTDVASTDLFYVVKDPGGSPVPRKATAANAGVPINNAVWTIIQASQLCNEVMNFPANVGIDVDLVAANQWWDSVATPSTAATMVDVAGEAGITETWEYALKCVADGSGDGLCQRYTYADQPRIKSGRVLSAIAAVWVGTAGRTVTMKLITSASTEVSATATAQAWTIIKAENLTLDGTYVDLQFTVDGADTFYVVPLGVNIGSKAVPLSPRGLRYIERAYSAVVNAVDPDAADWTDADFTATTSAITSQLYLHVGYNNSTTAGKRPQIRCNGRTDATGQVGPYSGVIGAFSSQKNLILCDDGQIIEYKTNAINTDTEAVTIAINGYWEWE